MVSMGSALKPQSRERPPRQLKPPAPFPRNRLNGNSIIPGVVYLKSSKCEGDFAFFALDKCWNAVLSACHRGGCTLGDPPASRMVGETGLEPARVSPRGPKPRASAIPPLAPCGHALRRKIITRMRIMEPNTATSAQT